MSVTMHVGLALPRAEERARVACWLRDAEMAVEDLVASSADEADADVAGLGLDCLVADAGLLMNGFLAVVRRHDRKLPIVALAEGRTGDPALARARVRVLPRPVDAVAVTRGVAAVHLRAPVARRRGRSPVPRLPSRAGGVPAVILDVSADGLRLEVARGDQANLGPVFRVQIPMATVEIVVRRAWVAPAPGDSLQCGGEIVAPSAAARLAWDRLLANAGAKGSGVRPPRRAPQAADIAPQAPAPAPAPAFPTAPSGQRRPARRA
ncbi:MAG: hypothetical protein R2745_14620 [Vicinamibacterales bacterium]